MDTAFPERHKYLKWYLLFGLIILSFVLWYIVLREDREGIMTFVVLDVGQGDALYIESPTGKQVIVDGGPNKTLMREISKVVPWYDRHLDMIVVTNPDRDHYEGFIPLLEKYKIDTVLEAGTTNPNPAYAIFQKVVLEKNIKKVIAIRGQNIDLGGGAFLQVLFPDRDISGLSPNDGSIVMKLIYGDTSVMLQGDSTSRIEEYLLSLSTTTLQSTILKAGHHGSKTSSLEKYIQVVYPKWTVISSGLNNSYGHPHKETLETMKKFNIPTLDTCNNGSLIFRSDGKIFTLKNKNPKSAEVGCKTN